MKIIDQFEVPYYQYLDENAKLVDDSANVVNDVTKLKELYHLMTLVRMIDTKAIALQRTGKLGTYPSTRGQEAVFVGVGHAMKPSDIYVPYYRDMGVLVQRGINLSQMLAYWGGDERGNCFAEGCPDLPISVPVGSQPLHAVGIGYAEKYKKNPCAVVTMCGEGATSQGDFYEAMNVAGVWKLPVVFVVCNNQWAISVPRDQQTAADTIAQKAIAAGFVGEQVDGNDIIAVQERMEHALKKAREQQTPTLLEMVCYRQHDHTTADDASRYEDRAVREAEWKKEPVARLKKYLESINAWDESEEQKVQEQCTLDINAAVEQYLNMEPQPLTSMIDYLYETLPEIYQEQREMLQAMEATRHA